MEKKNKKEEIQSRREFFKKAAKGTLPILGAVMLSALPLNRADAQWGCTSCSGGCEGCNDSCYGSCRGGCGSGCAYGCTGTCHAVCASCPNY